MKPLSRRTMLRGAAAAIGLPLLDAMQLPRAAAAHGATPKRAAFLMVPNGIVHDAWKPATAGLDYVLPSSLEPLAAVREHVSVITGLSQIPGGEKGVVTGHARPAAALLTGTVASKEEVRAGVSVDQVIAEAIGRESRLTSLELSVNGSQMAGLCDSGFSCVYSSVIAWRDADSPLPTDNDPRSVFRRIFGSDPGGTAAAADGSRDAMLRRSVLDAVLEDARRLDRTLGASDRRKLDEYLPAVRDVERRIGRSVATAADGPPRLDIPERSSLNYPDHVRLMGELIALAFQTDATRVCTFMLGNEAGNQAYPEVGVFEGHHELSHHGNVEEKMAKLRKIDRFNVALFAELVARLAATPEGEGSLLDNAAIYYGSGLGSGNAHTPFDLPVLLAGRAGGAIRPAGHVKLPMDTSLYNLWVTLLGACGAPVRQFGNSSGPIDAIRA
ncbi:MAG: DUF1552 domain-containing protein [Planctomycetia bacterium]